MLTPFVDFRHSWSVDFGNYGCYVCVVDDVLMVNLRSKQSYRVDCHRCITVVTSMLIKRLRSVKCHTFTCL